MWGIIPAAGAGSRIQPLAFSKELLPVGSRQDGDTERPRAVSEYLVERMINGGAKNLFCRSLRVNPTFWNTMAAKYSAGRPFLYCPTPSSGLCDAIFRAQPFIPSNEYVSIGLPDTIWFPEMGSRFFRRNVLSFLLFPVEHPEFFDAVVTDSGWSSEGNPGETERMRHPIGSGAPSECPARSCTNYS